MASRAEGSTESPKRKKEAEQRASSAGASRAYRERQKAKREAAVDRKRAADCLATILTLGADDRAHAAAPVLGDLLTKFWDAESVIVEEPNVDRRDYGQHTCLSCLTTGHAPHSCRLVKPDDCTVLRFVFHTVIALRAALSTTTVSADHRCA